MKSDVMRRRIFVQKEDGTKQVTESLWVNGKYVRDPRITFSQEERQRIDISIERIKNYLKMNH